MDNLAKTTITVLVLLVVWIRLGVNYILRSIRVRVFVCTTVHVCTYVYACAFIVVCLCVGDGTTISLVDVVFGEVYVCSGQSNMELSVIATLNATQEIAAAGSHGPNIRVMQVAMQSTYGNVSVPQANLSVSIPWGHPGSPADIKGHVGYSTAENGVVSVDITSMSGMCYYYGIELTQRHKDMPVGMIASSWGGTVGFA